MSSRSSTDPLRPKTRAVSRLKGALTLNTPRTLKTRLGFPTGAAGAKEEDPDVEQLGNIMATVLRLDGGAAVEKEQAELRGEVEVLQADRVAGRE